MRRQESNVGWHSVSRLESFSDQVPGDVRKRRTRSLKRLSRDKSFEFRTRHVGREMPIFVESMRRGGESLPTGLTDNYLRVDLGAGEAAEPLVTARLTSVTDDGLAGERVVAA